jgi:prefoldin subunit 5
MSTTPIYGTSPTPLPTALPLVEPEAASPAVTTAETTLPPTAPYLALPFARLSIEMLGINLPRTPEDTSAILAEVQLALELTVDETRNNRAQAIAASFRSALSGLGEIIKGLAALNAHYIDVETQKLAKEAERTEKVASREAKIQTSNSLQSQINDKNDQINSLNGQISSLNGNIDFYNGQIAVAQATNNPAAVAYWTTQRDAAVTQRNQLVQTRDAAVVQRDALVAQKQAVDAQIAQLTTAIDQLTSAIETLQQEMEATAQEYENTQGAMFNVFTQIAVFFRGLEPVNRLQDAGRDLGIFRGFEDLTANVETFGAMTRLREASEDLMAQIRDEDARTRILHAAAGLLAGLADLVATLSGLEEPSANVREGALEHGSRLRLAL